MKKAGMIGAILLLATDPANLLIWGGLLIVCTGMAVAEENSDAQKREAVRNEKERTSLDQKALDSEIDKRNGIKKCTGCYYYRPIVHVGTFMACHYLLDTSFPRDIRPVDCYKHANTPYKAKRHCKKDKGEQ